ncbi:mutator mutT protein [Myroides odoratimimus]|nr:mutator mutT protein [Myroides odoratimimus]
MIAQRNQNMLLPYKWEFPGGKVERGEQDEVCIVREVKEELNLNIEVQSRLTPVTHHYDTFSLELFPFICSTTSREFELKEHAQVLWVDSQDLLNYDWAEADIPIVKEYLELKLEE